MHPFEVALEQDRLAEPSEKHCMSNHGLTANRAVKGKNCANRAKKPCQRSPAAELIKAPVNVRFGTRGSQFLCQARAQPQFLPLLPSIAK